MVIWLIIVTGVLKQLANGPLWFNSEMINRCRQGWWTNLLFINNIFYSAEDNCLDGSWLISLMTQFTLLLIPGVMLMLWNRLMVNLLAVFVLAASMLYTFVIVMHNHLPPTLLMVPYISEQMIGYLNLIYIPPWTRLAPILTGLIAAPFFQQGQRVENNTLTRGFRWLLWLCWLGAAMVVVFGLNVSSTETWSACYSAIHRPLWSMAMVILLYLCHLDCAGELIGSLLEWRLFAPGARLSLGVLLAWEPVAVYVFGCQHRETYASHWSTLYSSISVISISYLIAFLIDVLFQRPVRRLLVHHLHQDDQHQLNHQK